MILAGLSTNSCVLFTAADAFLRDLHVFVPEECSASIDSRDHRFALQQMRELLSADTTPSHHIDFSALQRHRGPLVQGDAVSRGA